ncbi:MAG: serpin family protein [bacterium]|nr:serpin family protein [bacterium]
MFKKIAYSIFFCMIVISISCSTKIDLNETPDPNAGGLPRVLTLSEESIIQSGNEFSFKLFREINDWEKIEPNLFISPLSISFALGMALNGADGTTKEEMMNAMEIAGLTDEEINTSFNSLMNLLRSLDSNVTFGLANSVWIRTDFSVLESYKQACIDYFEADITTMNFNAPDAADIINAWIADKTNDKITDIIEAPIDPAAVMILVNAIYFMADWTIQFDPEDTEDLPFYHTDGSSIDVKMMSVKDDFRNFSGTNYKAVELPYSSGLFTMTILLPDTDVNIDEFIGDFGPDDMDQLISGLSAPEETSVMIPKLKFRYKLLMNDVLKAMGMNSAFDAGADFSRISDFVPWIGEVIHEGFVDVNEEGTEAAAVTVITFERGVSGNTFIANRPYMFVIRETESNTILFMGKITSPKIDS